MALLPFAEAKSALLASARVMADVEEVDLADAFGRVLAADLVSPMTVPPFSNAAMDGYALRAADAAGPGARLPVSQRIAAGDVPSPLATGSAARIFTGAQVPEGADSVVMQEDCEADGDAVIVRQPPVPGQHVRLRGSDLTQGKTLLTAGSRLSAAGLGLVASVGIGRVPLFRRLKAAIFFTGSELVMPGQPLPAGHIYNSNRYVMRGFLGDLGVDILDLGIVADDRAATRAALRRAAAEADLILTSGGMSVGEEDHVIDAVKAEGHIDVWKIAAKPGKPLAFGAVVADARETAFIGLPGNPVAVWSSLLTLVAPYIRRCQGLTRIEPERQRLRADFGYTLKGNRLEFVRVRRNERGGLDLYPTQDSAVISSAAWADGVALIPAGATILPGDVVEYLPGPGWTP
ncbi:MAG: molybdopterin molybdotransferase MoeA [Betaproteobacteria bacterium]|nr:molybdopterin molybdotransferase MoeA [Betaproteobacteria bacterium]